METAGLLVVAGLVLGVLTAGLAAVLVHLVASGRNAVPPVFTPREALDEVLVALGLPERGRLVDLGCGDGRVLEAARRLRPGLDLEGNDNNPVVLALARRRLGRGVRLTGRDIMKVDLARANRVFVYLGLGLMAQLEPKFERELGRGSRVVSQQFPLPGRKPTRIIELRGGKAHAARLFVYDY